MARTVGIGIQDFERLVSENIFYVDKTDFIREWWESKDAVTLITRPRRFGKTLNISMLNRFFSNRFAGAGSVFEGLSIWEHEEYRNLQGTYPVINLSFANVKETTFEKTCQKFFELIIDLYSEFGFLLDSDALSSSDKVYMHRVMDHMNEVDATLSIYRLSKFLYQYYGKKVIILLDEYDTPMQEAYVHGFWEEIVAFTRSLFNSAFKTNPWLERAVMTGITRVSKESIFSDLISLDMPYGIEVSFMDNLKVVTTTSDEYATAFGFTESEVYAALEECGLAAEKEKVREWYDGFVFGTHADIYNPWSIINFLDTGKYGTYWANTSANGLVSKLIREGSSQIKTEFEQLLRGEHLWCAIDEQIVYSQLDGNEAAIWSLLLASGYLKVLDYEREDLVEDGAEVNYELALTNYEVKRMFYSMVRGWFQTTGGAYNDFIKALLLGDTDAMNVYMNRVASRAFSYFDTGKQPSEQEPERFYHGFVLGLMVELSEQYVITSNRESGFGRYDVMLEPKNPKENDAVIIEFKVFNARRETSLEYTVQAALKQIEQKKYSENLLAKGIPEECIKKYGFAFEGKTVLIG